MLTIIQEKNILININKPIYNQGFWFKLQPVSVTKFPYFFENNKDNKQGISHCQKC
jgi:hypothetical protein